GTRGPRQTPGQLLVVLVRRRAAEVCALVGPVLNRPTVIPASVVVTAPGAQAEDVHQRLRGAVRNRLAVALRDTSSLGTGKRRCELTFAVATRQALMAARSSTLATA